MRLVESKCEPCRAGTPPLSRGEAEELAKQIPQWTLREKSIARTFRFPSFRQAIEFVGKVADIAEQEDHHPDIHIHYDRVEIELTTHKIAGLSRNDFVVAAKVDRLV